MKESFSVVAEFMVVLVRKATPERSMQLDYMNPPLIPTPSCGSIAERATHFCAHREAYPIGAPEVKL
jgi:hypothetical protein